VKALLQRVSAASIVVGNDVVAEIGKGMLIFLGVEKGDTMSDLEYLARKLCSIRIFDSEYGKMNLSVTDVSGEVLLVSQFTLAADCRKGNRPSFDRAEIPVKAEEMYLEMAKKLRKEGIRLAEGRFGAHMKVHILNDGPVTILLDSAKG
jgi:D-tyrosyl-tRNA(Tyr) deacylase